MLNKIKSRKGFTLIELLVVISIISFLSTIVLTSVNTARAKARDVQRLSDMKQLQNALELYRNTNGSYPVNNTNGGNWTGCGAPGIDTPLAGLVTGGYIKQIPKDPYSAKTGCWNYEYYSSSTRIESVFNCGGMDSSNYAYMLRFTTEKPLSSSWIQFYLYGAVLNRDGYEYCAVMRN